MSEAKESTSFDPTLSYDSSIESTSESELGLPEATQQQIKTKITKEEAKEEKLREAADYDIPPPGSNRPNALVIPVKDKYDRTETMPESRFDRLLRAKADRLKADQERLKRMLEVFDANINKIKSEASLNSSSTGYNILRRGSSTAEAYLRRIRRSKKAGHFGKTGSITSRARKKT